MKCEFSKKDLENMIVVFFQKKGAILTGISLKEVAEDDQASLKCKLITKQKVFGVEKDLEKELSFNEVKALINLIFSENLNKDSQIKKINYNIGFVPDNGSLNKSREVYFNGVDVEIETAIDKVVDSINKYSTNKNRGK